MKEDGRGSPPVPVQEALAHRKAREIEAEGEAYICFNDDFRGVPRGTAVFADCTVYGYPQIGRILALQAGLAEQFAAPFWVEEKIDGYNVRVFRRGERVLALTRGGFVCPFTTDRIGDLMDAAVFEHEPDLVVCAEVAGPDNPYLESSPPFIKRDVRLFAFDLGRLGCPGFLPQEDKHRLIEQHGLPAVPCFGRYRAADVDALQAILERLDREWREGVVFKQDRPEPRRAKYVTSTSSVLDIRATAYNILDLPPEYFINRIMRLVLFMEEQGLDSEQALADAIGEAFVGGMREAIDQFKAQHKVFRTYTCRFRTREAAQRMLVHLGRKSRQVQVNKHDLRREGDYWVLEFERVSQSMSGMLNHLLSGGVVYD